jgi:hypothetical protein
MISPSRRQVCTASPCRVGTVRLLQLFVSVRCRALAVRAIGHSAWSVRVASKALLSFQRMGRNVRTREVCSHIRVYTRFSFSLLLWTSVAYT